MGEATQGVLSQVHTLGNRTHAPQRGRWRRAPEVFVAARLEGLGTGVIIASDIAELRKPSDGPATYRSLSEESSSPSSRLH